MKLGFLLTLLTKRHRSTNIQTGKNKRNYIEKNKKSLPRKCAGVIMTVNKACRGVSPCIV